MDWVVGTGVTKAFNEKAKLHLELSRAGMAEDVGLIGLNNAPLENAKPEIIAKKKKQQHTAEIMRLIEQTREKLNDFIYKMDLDLFEAKQELQRYQDMTAERAALSHGINALERGETLERNPDGTLKDKHLQNAVEHYAGEHHLPTNFNDDAYVLALARNAIETYHTAKHLEQLVDVQTQIVDVMQTGRDEAVSIQHDLDNADNLSETEVKEKCSQAYKNMDTTTQTVDGLTERKNVILDTGKVKSHEIVPQHQHAQVLSPQF